MATLLSAQAVIFDMDGVLVDSEPVHVDAMRDVLAPFGIAYSDRENEEFFGFTDLATFGILRARYGLAPSVEELVRQRTERLVAMLPTQAIPMPGVPEVLHRLRAGGYPLALASGSAPPVIRATLRALGVERLFAPIVSAVEVPRGKPAPDVFLETARRLGVTPEDCLVVEDSRNGLLAAVAAGMACAAIPCPATRTQDFSEATVRLDALTELVSLLPPRTGPRS